MPNDFSRWARDELGLAPAAELELECSLLTASRPPVGQALAVSRTSTLELVQLVSDFVSWVGRVPTLPEAAAALDRAGVVLKEWEGNVGVFALDARGAALRWHGTVVERGPGELLIDARFAPVGVHVVSPRGELVLRMAGGEARMAVVRRTVVIPVRDGYSVPKAPEVPDDLWLGGIGATDWLLTAAGGLARSPSPADRIAAAGMLTRLWVPVDARALEAPNPVLDRVLAWAATLSDEVLTFAENVALGRVDLLRESVDSIAESDAPPEDLEARMLVACLARDDLACVETILHVRGRGDALTVALDGFDAEVRELGSRLPGPLDLEDERLVEVSATEPDAWWAAP